MAHTFYMVYVNNLKLNFNSNHTNVSTVLEHELEDYKENVLQSFENPNDLVQMVSVLNVLNVSIVNQILNNVQDIDKTEVKLAVYITSSVVLIRALSHQGLDISRYQSVLKYILERESLVTDLGLALTNNVTPIEREAVLNVLTVFYKYLAEISLTIGLGYEPKEAAMRYKLLSSIGKDIDDHGNDEVELVKDAIDLELS